LLPLRDARQQLVRAVGHERGGDRHPVPVGELGRDIPRAHPPGVARHHRGLDATQGRLVRRDHGRREAAIPVAGHLARHLAILGGDLLRVAAVGPISGGFGAGGMFRVAEVGVSLGVQHRLERLGQQRL